MSEGLRRLDDRKLLVCAQSNAAIAEVCHQVWRGLWNPDGMVDLWNRDRRKHLRKYAKQLAEPGSPPPTDQPLSTKAWDRLVNEMTRMSRKGMIDGALYFTTLSGAGSQFLDEYSQHRFETVIIDEAAQATELSSIIPLRYDCNRCIMLGGQ